MTLRLKAICGIALATQVLWATSIAVGQPERSDRASAPASSDFIRVTTGEGGMPASLQTSIMSFASPPSAARDLRVDLVSAVHIGDAAYYAALNQRFRDYDAVLYELIAPEGTRVPAGGGDHGGFVSGTQVAMTRLLDLSFQLDEIDYTQANLVHADLSPQEVARSMTDRGESLSQYVVKLFAAAMSEQARDPYGLRDVGLLAALFSPDRSRLLKAQFAAAMLDMGTFTEIIEGEDGSTLVSERNKRAVRVLGERIAIGDRRIAIFYGAAHMPDMAQRIESDHGLVRERLAWIDAWELR